jgi:glycosyltransferase involved in cell wall biosynthesis
MDGIRASVVICTYGRPDLLERTIERVTNQELGTGEYETIVVYTEGDSPTETLLGRLDPSGATLRTYAESKGSLSNARNVGLDRARGEYVLYLDDDAVPLPGWLARTCDTFDEVEPTPSCVGGRVDPVFETEAPWWLPDQPPGLPICDLGDEPRWVDFPQEFVVGANMAFPADQLAAAGGFPADLGRKEGNMLGGEDLAAQYGATNQRGVYYQPGSRVRHHIGSERLTARFFLRRFYAQGIIDCRLERFCEEGPATRRAAARRAVEEVVPIGYRTVQLLRRGDRRSVFDLFAETLTRIGYAAEQLGVALWGGSRGSEVPG